MNSSLPIEVTVRIDFADYWRATHSYMFRFFKFKQLIVGAVGYLCLFLYLAYLDPLDAPKYLLIPLAGVGFVYAMLYLNTKMVFAGKKFLQHPVRYQIGRAS